MAKEVKELEAHLRREYEGKIAALRAEVQQLRTMLLAAPRFYVRRPETSSRDSKEDIKRA